MTQEMILDALAHCVKNDCGDSCPMKGKDWTNRGLAACEAFAEGETVEMPVKLIEHVIKLLKAQEPVEPKIMQNIGFWCECGFYLGLNGGVKYCAMCGKPVKWK